MQLQIINLKSNKKENIQTINNRSFNTIENIIQILQKICNIGAEPYFIKSKYSKLIIF